MLDSICLSVQVKKRIIHFQDGGHGGHSGYLDFLIRRILIITDLFVTPMRPTKFQDNWLLIQEKKRNVYFQDSGHCGHLGFQI